MNTHADPTSTLKGDDLPPKDFPEGVKPASLSDLLALGKPRLSSMVLFTGGTGILLAPGELSPARAVATLLGTMLVVMAANALNCYLESDSDAQMRRTKTRPLAAGRMPAPQGLFVGLHMLLLSMPLMYLGGGLLTVVLGLFGLVFYVSIYTPMKPLTTWALPAGSIPGAIPPVMGWSAVTGSLDVGAFILFTIMVVWQLPHFLAVSLYLREDYKRGGHKVFSLVHGVRRTTWAVTLSCLLLIPTSLLPTLVGMSSWLYGIAALILSSAFFALSLPGLKKEPPGGWARSHFLWSLAYLPLLFAALVFL